MDNRASVPDAEGATVDWGCNDATPAKLQGKDRENQRSQKSICLLC